jgi:hypothetical protein
VRGSLVSRSRVSRRLWLCSRVLVGLADERDPVPANIGQYEQACTSKREAEDAEGGSCEGDTLTAKRVCLVPRVLASSLRLISESEDSRAHRRLPSSLPLSFVIFPRDAGRRLLLFPFPPFAPFFTPREELQGYRSPLSSLLASATFN